MSDQPLLILSTCGTSLLTNGAGSAVRERVTRYANTRQRGDVNLEDATLLEQRIAEVGSALASASLAEAGRRSAELNTIIRLYNGSPAAAPDTHILLCTDTWLGEASAELVATWLRDRGAIAVVHRQKDLQTARLDAFQLALSDLVRWCDQTLPTYRGYRVVFNLTGGFKSIQGFMQTLAMFRNEVDEVVYVFESGDELLRIPRLPVRLDVVAVVRDHLAALRRLANGLQVHDAIARRIPETLTMRVGPDLALSPWGELMWNEARAQIYAEQLHPSPSEQVRYAPPFVRACADLAPDRLVLLNERIDDLAHFVESGRSYNPRSLEVKKLVNPAARPPSTHEADAWSDRDARRLYLHFDGAVCVVDALDRKL